MKRLSIACAIAVLAGSLLVSLYLRAERDATAPTLVTNSADAHEPRPGPESEGVTPVLEAGPGRVQPQTAQDVMNAGGSLSQALGTGTVIRSEAEANLLFEGGNCGLKFDANLIGGDDHGFDETRAWAIARIIEACDGFDPEGYRVELERPPLMQSMLHAGWDATRVHADDTLRHSTLVTDVVLSGQLMLENDEFPFDEIDPGLQALGGQEILTALTRAAMLRSCDAAGGCGPRSLQVAAICANVGCPQGLTLAEVYSRKLPADELQAVRAIHAWMSRNRR